MDDVQRARRVLVIAWTLVVLLSGLAQSSPELPVEQVGNRFQAGKGYVETFRS